MSLEARYNGELASELRRRLLRRIEFYRPRTDGDVLNLPAAGIFAPYIGCESGLFHLFDEEIYSVADVARRSRAELLAIKGIGPAKVAAIEAALEVLGLELAPDRPEPRIAPVAYRLRVAARA